MLGAIERLVLSRMRELPFLSLMLDLGLLFWGGSCVFIPNAVVVGLAFALLGLSSGVGYTYMV